ncbi:MAG TPA: hypothetical protein DEB24_01855 [Coriobacteriia bacterium]|nr:hypothetical protein [Coriobacteriia bacterium]
MKTERATRVQKVPEADIYKAFDTVQIDAEIDEIKFQGKYLLIGIDSSANLMEIMYNVIGDGKIRVFHAMKCRKTFLPLL